MDENKWEYDYSSSNNPAGDTGYPNVGSSGMNTANTASAFSEKQCLRCSCRKHCFCLPREHPAFRRRNAAPRRPAEHSPCRAEEA